ncbi:MULTISPECIES: hypothetical protein [Gracilibacillus]|uniref:hypothetical protein n=1 Tax=Gracilibacillus TaxID=74385 RepID=UPI000824665C|nr:MULTISPECIES: hypothetical protein [Gracilibacillus]
MLANLTNLYDLKEELNELGRNHPALYEKLKHVVSLTRQLQIPYKYLGELVENGYVDTPQPAFIRESVLQLYQTEVEKLRTDEDIEQLLRLMKDSEATSYSQLFLLVLGANPEFIRINTIIK